MPSDKGLQEKVQNGKMIETEEEMTEGYKETLKTTLLVSADTELISAPWIHHQAVEAPTLNTRAAEVSILQDELGHAHIAFRLLEDLGEDTEELVYERDPHEFRNSYGFDHHLDNFAELIVGHCFYDRAGMVLLGDIHENTSYGPWKRALAKVDKEEQFHLRHGETWMRRLVNKSESTKQKVQDAVDWMFPMTVEWFGLPDDKKRHTTQLDYRIKGKSNDELRQTWLEEAVPVCNEMGLDVPAYYDEGQDEYVLEYDFPVAFDENNKEWRFDEPISWSDVMDRWKNRGPAINEYVDMIQSGKIDIAT